MGCISFMSVDKPGWYLRQYNYQIYLEPQVNPRNPTSFASDASFYIRQNTFLSGYVALESFSLPGYFVLYNSTSLGPLFLATNPISAYENENFQLLTPTVDVGRKRRSVTGNS